MKHPPTDTKFGFARIDGEGWYWCDHRLSYSDHKGAVITIPAFFMGDGGSVPNFARVWIETNDDVLLAYHLHDFCYKKDFPHEITRKHADKLLYLYCRAYGMSWIKSQAVYVGLKFGGWATWKKRNTTYATD